MSRVDAVVLELDLGNTRLKWRCLSNGDVPVVGFLVRADYPSLAACLAALLLELSRDGWKESIALVRVASVASPAVGDEIVLWGQRELDVDVRLARVSRYASGVTNGYQDYRRLGVDRWLALLAAHQLAPEGFCVVDCGSAVTLDLVVAGEHQGGYIVPGLRLMNEALFSSTDGVKVDTEVAVGAGSVVLGRNTADAVNLGLPMMVASLVEETLARFEREHALSLRLVLTGGDAPAVAGLISGSLLCRPDLVLDGLALAEFG